MELQEIGADWTKDGRTYHYISRIGGMYYSKYWRDRTRHFADHSPSAEIWDGCEHYGDTSLSLDAELSKRGISTDSLHGLKLTQILSYMDEDAHFETLWKQGDWQIAKFFRKNLDRYWSQIRIARKHGYVLNEDNLTEWKDLVDMLRWYLHKDTRNPKYICPADLHQAHQDVITERNRQIAIENERRRREQDEWNRRHAEEKMKKAKETEKEFIKRREKYFDLSIKGSQFTIVCLKSIEEFRNEGTMLNHCVFMCGYYDKADSLILSARDADNNPIETIEIDLRSFKILQCYGYHDSYTALHNEIVKTMESNMWQVKDIRLGKAKAA